MHRTIRCSGGDVHYHPMTSRYIGVGEDIAHGGSGREKEQEGRERGKEGEGTGREGEREGGGRNREGVREGRRGKEGGGIHVERRKLGDWIIWDKCAIKVLTF